MDKIAIGLWKIQVMLIYVKSVLQVLKNSSGVNDQPGIYGMIFLNAAVKPNSFKKGCSFETPKPPRERSCVTRPSEIFVSFVFEQIHAANIYTI